MEERRTSTSTEASNTEQASTSNPTTNLAVRAVFVCPVCYDYLIRPIFQCSEGHTICSRCKSQVQQCPHCRVNMGSCRNLALERLSEIIALPCKFGFNGCPETRVFPEREAHERYCEYRSCSCPSLDSTCQWEGMHQQVISHIEEKHLGMLSLEHHSVQMNIIGLELTQTVIWTTRLHCY
ncbi:E3 ubiquitin-protein ligase sina-like [Centruroides vittatus]|uniref:E3 ubiquitin-protein ligase sina-like n=1 Tax=Centruroides vittatus TaxID=120091 RepID=UPI00351053C3